MADRVWAWWHHRRHANCAVCGAEFRKGKGGGLSGRTLCSDACYGRAWGDWVKGSG